MTNTAGSPTPRPQDSARSANAIRAFIPVSYVVRAKFIGSRASLLDGRGALAAPAGGLHPPYALVLDYMVAVAAAAPDAAIAG
jgi:hypothetical protein